MGSDAGTPFQGPTARLGTLGCPTPNTPGAFCSQTHPVARARLPPALLASGCGGPKEEAHTGASSGGSASRKLRPGWQSKAPRPPGHHLPWPEASPHPSHRPGPWELPSATTRVLGWERRRTGCVPPQVEFLLNQIVSSVTSRSDHGEFLVIVTLLGGQSLIF